MRLWIAAFLLLLFACQALPVAALGKSLVKTQLSDTGDAGDDEGGNTQESNGKIKKEAPGPDEYFMHVFDEASQLYAQQSARQLFLHRPDHLPVPYACEVTTPPPDYS